MAAICLPVPTGALAQDVEPPSPLTETPLPGAGKTAENPGLDTIYVTGLRRTLDEAQEKLDLRAGGTSLIGADVFENTRATNLSDVLAFAPGVLAQTRHGEETRLSIRGSGIQRGFQLRGIQLYQDGVPLNLADGGGDFQAIDPLAVQFVEIWRGGNALEYGSSALGGAVNFVTPTGRTSAPVAVRLDGGAFGQRRGTLQLGATRDALDGALSVTFSEQDGWRDQSATRATRASVNIGYRVSDTLDARLYLNYVDSELELPGPLSLQQLTDDPEQAGRNYAERNASNDYIMRRAALRLSWTPTEGADITASLYHFDRDRNHPTIFGTLDQQAENTGLDIRSVFDFAKTDAARRLVIGISGVRYKGEEERFANVNGQRGAFRGRRELDGRTYLAYAEYSHGLSDRLTLQTGAQFTRAERELDNLASPAGSFDEAFNGFSPKFGVLYDINDADQVYANVTRSFEPAPFGEARVLPDLPVPDAQRATTYEIGWRRRAGAVNIEASAYYATIDNEFLALIDETGVSLGTTNADNTVHRGGEFGASLPLSPTVDLRATYLWSDFRFDEDAAFGDNRLAGVPPHSLNAQLAWSPTPWLTISPRLEWRTGTIWIDHANTVGDDGYALAHLGVSGDLPGAVEWFVDVRNLADKEYISTTLVRDDVNGADSTSYFPGEPRSVFGGLRWRY